ncbi:MAG: hypothetical protein II919_03565 [Lachnospiraceae bacterium]|nr:hypothetical protein [Lachnospiraceae bacterium]
MISEQIKDVKKFMSELLINNTFDKFLVADISITTYNTFHIDGHLQKDFFDEDEWNELPDQHLAYWETLRPVCFSLIKGNKTPVRFKMIFALDKKSIRELLQSIDTTISEEDINELFFNIKYENNILTYVTGCSLKIFTMDKSLEKAFDQHISELTASIAG